MGKMLDLRTHRRISVAEGRVILDAMESAGVKNDKLRAKLMAAIERATHACNKRDRGRCSVCGVDPEAVKRYRAHQAKQFQERIRASNELQKQLAAKQRERALTEPPPKLTLTRPD